MTWEAERYKYSSRPTVSQHPSILLHSSSSHFDHINMFFSTALFTIASAMAALVAATPVAEKAGETVCIFHPTN